MPKKFGENTKKAAGNAKVSSSWEIINVNHVRKRPPTKLDSRKLRTKKNEKRLRTGQKEPKQPPKGKPRKPRRRL